MRRLRALVLTLVGLLTIAGWSSAGVRPYPGPASAQVVTPDPSPPSFANQRFVIGSDNISNPDEGNPPTFATAVLPDPNAFPTTTVQVHNYEGFTNEQRFWLSVRIRQQDAGVEVVPEPGYAQMGLIAPGGDATYTVTFPEATSARVEFEVDGSTDEAILLTLLQFALEAGFVTADVTGFGGHDAEIGQDLAEVVAEQYLADLPTLVPCANAVAAVQRGLDDQGQLEHDLQGCLESPMWHASVDQVLARVAERDWFQQSLNLAGKGIPQVGAALKTVKVGQFAAQLWTMYEKFHPEVSGAMIGSVAFLSINTSEATPPASIAGDLTRTIALIDPSDLATLLLTRPIAGDELPPAFTVGLARSGADVSTGFPGAITAVSTTIEPPDAPPPYEEIGENTWVNYSSDISYAIYPDAGQARRGYEDTAELFRQYGASSFTPSTSAHPEYPAFGLGGDLSAAGLPSSVSFVIVQVGNVLVIGSSSRPGNVTDQTTSTATVEQPWLRIVFQVRPPDDAVINPETLLAVRNAVEHRAKALGALNPVVQTMGSDTVILETPVVLDAGRMVGLLSEPSLLEIIDPQGQNLPPGTLVSTTLGPPLMLPASGPVYDTIVSASDLVDVFVTTDQAGTGRVLGFELNDLAGERLFEFTNSRLGEPMSMVIDKQVISSPVIQSAISTQGIIVGIPDDRLEDVLVALRSGPLPMPVEVVQSQMVDPIIDAANRAALEHSSAL